MKTLHQSLPGHRHQRGALMTVLGVTLAMLIGFAGLAIDLGRFFVIKTELQNAVDACALAAASQLRPGQHDPGALIRARAYGRVFSTGGTGNLESIKNKVNFQSETVAITDADISFFVNLDDGSPTSDPNTAHFAKCDYPLAGLPIYFMKVINAALSTETVSAMAMATLGRRSCNVVPAGLCEKSAAPDHGFMVGEWLSIGDKMAPGFFGWVDYSTSAGGSSEVRDGLTAVGQCDIPVVGAKAEENGKKTSAEDAWNTRFGIYTLPYRLSDITQIPPDSKGYAYFNAKDPDGNAYPWANWPRADLAAEPRAYNGTNPPGDTTIPNYQNVTASTPYQVAGRTILGGAAQFADEGQIGASGRSERRILTLPILDCNTKPKMTITALGCGLMLNPFGKSTGGGPAFDIKGKIEYLGLVGDADSPCGNANVTGPNMSMLVK